jgi:hypothetical protein
MRLCGLQHDTMLGAVKESAVDWRSKPPWLGPCEYNAHIE